jgi:endonuclease YncB( thermonuclease family)
MQNKKPAQKNTKDSSITALLKSAGVSAKAFLAILSVLAATGASFGGYQIYKDTYATNYTPEPKVLVTEVLDGDTFVLEEGEHIRLSEIDAPEKGGCFADEASKALEKLVLGRMVILEKQADGADNFDRLLRYARVVNDSPKEENILINKYLLENGYAKYSNSKNSDNNLYKLELVQAENSARQRNLGLWKACPGEMSRSELESGRRVEKSVGPSDPKCLIKGNISETFGRKYFLPHCRNYYITKIDPTKGEAYFCTAKDAEKANFIASEDCK